MPSSSCPSFSKPEPQSTHQVSLLSGKPSHQVSLTSGELSHQVSLTSGKLSHQVSLVSGKPSHQVSLVSGELSQVSLTSDKLSHQVSLMSGKSAGDVKEEPDIPSRMSSASLMGGKPLSSRSLTVGKQRTLLLGKLNSRLAGVEEEGKQVIVGLEMLENKVKALVEEAKLTTKELDSEGVAMDKYSVISQQLVQVEDEITMISASLYQWLNLSSESGELDDIGVSYVEEVNDENITKEVILGGNDKNCAFENEEKVEVLTSNVEMIDIDNKAKHVVLEDKVDNIGLANQHKKNIEINIADNNNKAITVILERNIQNGSEVNKQMETVQIESIEDMSQKLLGNSEPVFPQKSQDDSPITPTKIPEVEEQFECKTTNFGEDVAYANSCSPATGLHMIEATSTVHRSYVFTIEDRSVIARFLAPLVKDLVIINKIGGIGKKSVLHIGIVVESQQQFFCAIKAANDFFKSEGFQFKHWANGRDVLHFLSEDKVIPKVDCSGMYPIIVKFNLPKGNEKKVDASLGRQLEKEIRGCGVEKISFGLGERILLMGHVKDIIRVSKKVKKVFDIIPSKHTWNKEPDMAKITSSKIRRKDRKAKPKERSNKVDLGTSSSSNLKSDLGQRLDVNLLTIQQEKEMSAP